MGLFTALALSGVHLNGASQSYCGDRPNHCCDLTGQVVEYNPNDIYFKGIFMGHSGAMKSTTIDLITGGHFLTVTSYESKSMTELSQCYVFDYLDDKSQDHSLRGQKWLLIDTPGTADSSAELRVERQNAEQMGNLLRSVGNLDAIFVAWDFRTIRDSPEILNSVASARAVIGPGMWKKLFMVYTFIHWETAGNPALQTGRCRFPRYLRRNGFQNQSQCEMSACVKHDNISAYHATRIYDLQGYISSTFGAPEPMCIDDNSGDCFPDPLDIPFIGIGHEEITADHDQTAMFSSDYYSDSSSGCELNTVQQLQSALPQHAREMTGHRLDLSHLPNGYAHCLRAREVFLSVPDEAQHHEFKTWALGGHPPTAADLANSVSKCLDTGIDFYKDELTPLIAGRSGLQEVLAFSLYNITNDTYLGGEYGFDRLDRHVVTVWPDYSTKHECIHATDASDPSSGRCQLLLQDFYVTFPPLYNRLGNNKHQVATLANMAANLRCECETPNDSLQARYRCSLVGVQQYSHWFDCGPSQYCSSLGASSDTLTAIPLTPADVPFNIPRQICLVTPTCSSFTCDSTHYAKFTAAQIGHLHCTGAQCTSEQCCHTKALCSEMPRSLACDTNSAGWTWTPESKITTRPCPTNADSCTQEVCCRCNKGAGQCAENFDQCPSPNVWSCGYFAWSGCSCDAPSAFLDTILAENADEVKESGAVLPLGSENTARMSSSLEENITGVVMDEELPMRLCTCDDSHPDRWACGPPLNRPQMAGPQHNVSGRCGPNQFCISPNDPITVTAAGPGFQLCNVAATCDSMAGSCDEASSHPVSEGASLYCEASPCGVLDQGTCCLANAHCPAQSTFCKSWQYSNSERYCGRTLDSCDEGCCEIYWTLCSAVALACAVVLFCVVWFFCRDSVPRSVVRCYEQVQSPPPLEEPLLLPVMA